jgi:putative MATE family efflux protein
MAAPARAALLEGDVAATLRSMTLTSAAGMLAMIATSLVDTYWVSRLGTAQLAAISFAFPLESLVMNVGLGLMIGTSTAVARATGTGDSARAARLTTHAVVLAVGFVALLAGAGYLWHAPLFRALGADAATLAQLSGYVRTWCVGIVFMMVPLVVNGALRAVGDAQTPMRVMLLGACLTALLDPLFIFGAGPVPAMGLRGAATASLCARVLVSLTVLVVMARRGLLDRTLPSRAELGDSVRTILRVGGPAILTNALGPLAVTLVTGIVASHGAAALAGYGTGARVDALVMIAPFALSGALSPFVGQNWAAHLRKRVAIGVRGSVRFVLVWGVLCAVALLAGAEPIAARFSDDPDVRTALVTYLRTIPVGYAFLAAVGVASSVFNAVDQALRSTMLSVLRSLVVAVPAAWVGGMLGGLTGVYLGLVVASMVAAILGVHWLRGT